MSMQPLLRLLAFMSIHVALHHVTHYRYDRPVQLGPQVIRLRPAPHSRSRILSYSLRIEPAAHFINWQQDPFANYQARLVFPQKTSEFKVTVDLVPEMAVFNPFDFFLEPSAEHVPLSYSPELKEELNGYLEKLPRTPLFKKYLASPRPVVMSSLQSESGFTTIHRSAVIDQFGHVVILPI